MVGGCQGETAAKRTTRRWGSASSSSSRPIPSGGWCASQPSRLDILQPPRGAGLATLPATTRGIGAGRDGPPSGVHDRRASADTTRMSFLRSVSVAGAVGALALLTLGAAGGSASMIVDRSTSNQTLEVDRNGTALVSYTTPDGTDHHVLYWGAVDWEGRFQRDYSGGWGSKRADWKHFTNACRPYTG